ncbi:DUF4336 domain-containing protein [Oleiagrimonas sp. C23AA]|uniref:DUF4336 domain-containing protein n=1 Tax=Oleiagrimonas sp. C23AA TaxID=2719047 RepID=UPI0014239238|nr:DUF4336 domain-containing protein [Oleiagrimonas sp. C23AA]NII10727.1 DUF4336 domain-containing protein [Oleiagrimonas sp. C23AA]
MSGGVGTYAPLGTLKAVAEDVWIVDGPIVRMPYLLGSIPFSTRMTVIRLSDGGLWCHSPVQLDAGLRQQIDALGPVRHLISPNKLHYAHIGAWQRAFPEAIAWASPGVRERAASQHIDVTFQFDLGASAPAAWAGQIDQLVFAGSRFMEEVVFFHRASRTLVLADLIENFESQRVSPWWRALMRLAGSADPDGKLPIDLRLTFLGRKRRARACLERMLAWQPERVLLAHGRCYLENGTRELRRAFRWLR